MPITINSSKAAVAAIPYLLGFEPQDSLVILFDGASDLHLTLRVDLPPYPEIAWIQSILAGLNEPLPQRAVLVAFADRLPVGAAIAASVWAGDVLRPLMAVADTLVVADGRVVSLQEPLPGECDDELRLDEDLVSVESLQNHPVVAECVAAGLSKVGTRGALAQRLLPVDDGVSKAVAKILARPSGGDYEQWRDRLERRSVRILCGRADLTPADVAAVGRACSDWFVRDPLISLILKRQAASQVSLGQVRTRLTYALVHLPESHAGAVAATLALLSWADGDGAAALVAVDRAREADPGNSLAPLVEQALQNGLPPSTWSDLTHDIPMEVLRGRDRRRSA